MKDTQPTTVGRFVHDLTHTRACGSGMPHTMRLREAAAALLHLSQRTGRHRPLVHTRWTDEAAAAAEDEAAGPGGGASRPTTQEAKIRSFDSKSNAHGSSDEAARGAAGESSTCDVQQQISEWHLEQLSLPPEDRDDACMQELAAVVKTIPALSLRPLGLCALLCRLATVVCLDEGDFVFRAGDRADESFFLLMGRVKLEESRADGGVIDEGGTDVDVEVGMSLDWGLPLIREKMARKATAVCIQDSMVLRLDRADLELAHDGCHAEALLDLLHKPPTQRDENELTEIDDKCLAQVEAFSRLHVDVRKKLARHLLPQLVQKSALLWNRDDEAEDVYITYGAILEAEAGGPLSSRSMKKMSSQASTPAPDHDKELSPPPKSPLGHISRTCSSGGIKAMAILRSASCGSNSSANMILRTSSVAGLPKEESEGLVQGGGVAGWDALSGARRNKTFVVRETGFVFVLGVEQLRAAVSAHTDAESLRKMEVVKSGLDLDVRNRVKISRRK